MAIHCPYCKSFDIGAGFDLFQCFSCGGHMTMDGQPAVPTSAIETEHSVYDGPGKELIETPTPPLKAKDPVPR